MRQFYLFIRKGATLSHQLSWSHYIELINVNYVNKINYYIRITEQNNLSVRELNKNDIGQIEIYMNCIDKNLKRIDMDKTIGIIICKKDNCFIMEYCSDKRILAREYKLI